MTASLLRSAWIVSVCLGGAMPAHAEGAADAHICARRDGATIDWTTRTLLATGRAAPSLPPRGRAHGPQAAELQAGREAVRRLVDLAMSLWPVAAPPANASSGDAPSRQRAQLEALAQNHRTLETRYFADGGVEVDAALSFDAGVLEVLCGSATAGQNAAARPITPPSAQGLPGAAVTGVLARQTLTASTPTPDVPGSQTPQTLPAPPPQGPPTPSAAALPQATAAARTGEAVAEPQGPSLLLQLVGEGMVPSLSPRLLDEGGNDLMSASVAPAPACGAALRAVFVRGMQQATRVATAREGARGERPVVVRVRAAAHPTDVVLAPAEANRLRRAMAAGTPPWSAIFILP